MRKIIAVYQGQFTGNEIYQGESLEQVLDAMTNDGENYKEYAFYDLTDVVPSKLKLELV